MNFGIPGKQEIIKAHDVINKMAHRTPVLSSESINKIAGCEIFFKCENFQKVGAFKFRGASFAVTTLNEKKKVKGVATHSSGNHAAALALAARMNHIPAYIVMPETAPEIKKKAVKGYGAKITFCEPTQAARENTLLKIIEEKEAEFIHPYDDYRIICGQATCAKELIEDHPDLKIILTPVGGGGLLSGSILSAKYFSDGIKIIAGEPAGADDAFRSIRDNKIYPSLKPKTIADGLLTSLSQKTFDIISQNINEIITVDEEQISEAMRIIWERMKIIIEPSSAVPFAVVLNNKNKFAGKKIGIILSGGNVDLEKLPW